MGDLLPYEVLAAIGLKTSSDCSKRSHLLGVQYTEQHMMATGSNQEPETLHRLLNTLEVGDHGHLLLLLLGVHLGMVSLPKPFFSDVISLEVVLCTAALLGSAEWFRKTGYSC